MKGKNSKTQKKRIRRKYDDRLKEQAANRRKLLSSLDPETAALTRRDFAKLGLFQ